MWAVVQTTVVAQNKNGNERATQSRIKTKTIVF